MFESLKQEMLGCRLCRERFGFEPRPVFWGSEKSKIVQIGQAPSQTVHRTGKPFDDASGRRLRGEWYHVSEETFYNPDNFYFASIGRCYPGRATGGGDRPPPKCCAGLWLERELPLVKNALYVVIGGHAARYFFPGKDFSPLVFADQEIRGKPAYVLPHPSPLNIKWFKDNPEFLKTRVREIREGLHGALEADSPARRDAGAP